MASRKKSGAGPGPTIDEAALLSRWRETRSPLLADILCCAPLGNGWAKRIEEAKRFLPRYAQATIAELPDDPRTTVILVELLAAAEWRGTNSRDLWTWVFARLVALRDVRCVPALRAMAATPPRFFQQKFTRWAAGEIAKVADALAKVAPAPDDPKTRTLAGAQTVELPPHGFFPRDTAKASLSLVEQVWNAPDDRALRAVVADGLQELGDPWGELIALQLAGKPVTDLLDLDGEHIRRFCGPLYDACPFYNVTAKSPQHTRLTFRDGFLETCTVGNFYQTTRDWAEAAVAPHWATVRGVTFAVHTPKLKWFREWWRSGHLRSLRRIAFATTVMEREAPGEAWRFTTLPRTMRDVFVNELALLLKAMPPEERDRIPLPPEDHPVGALLRTLGRRRSGGARRAE